MRRIGGSLGVFQWILQYHTYFSVPACNACTDMVYSKELERDVTTTAMTKAILRLKTLAFIPSQNMIDSFFIRPSKGCQVHAMCKMLLF